ncbi:MAG: glycoside hydrolase family 3 N-terminal domain-containing protein, partial [Chloroflexota bacterium]
MKRQSKMLIPVVLMLILLSAVVTHADDPAPYLNPDLPVDQRVEDLLERMSLAEKIGQMTLIEKNSIMPGDVTRFAIGGLLSGGGGYPSPNTAENWAAMVDGYQDAALATPLAIPMIYGVDAVHGHNNLIGATIFPQEIGLGATRDADLVKQIGRATAQEMIATGIYWDYAPVIAVPQDIRWGRTYEGYGENTELVSTLGAALIEGLQTDSLANPQAVLATPKHFVGDGGAVWGTSSFGPSNIDQGVTDVDEATLRAIHLPPYEAAIKAGAQSIMVSYSSWGGMKMSAQKYLITDVLKGELGFTGFIVSDWKALNQISPDTYLAIVSGINAGIDMNMVPTDYRGFIATMNQAVGKGDITQERIDDAVRRILRVKFEMGLFEHPKSDSLLLATVGSEDHRALARRAVSESLVLLKNDSQTLPIGKDTATIYVAGGAADDIGRQSGGWTIEWQGKIGATTPGTSILEGIEAAVGAGAKVQYDADGKFDSTVADVGIVVVGEYPYAEYKGDNSSLNLSPEETALIETMRAESKKLVVILISGRPLIIESALGTADAFVAAWLPGTEGEGVADGLFGDQPFTGKLSYTWPRTIEQIPFDFKNLPTTGCDAPLFPYGYGLDASTTTSPYLDLAAQCSGATTVRAEAISQPVVEATVEATVEPTPAPDQVVNDFEGALWTGLDADGAGIGLVPWGDTPENANLSIRQLIPHSALAVPEKEGAINDVLAVAYNITGWGGFSDAFTDGTVWTTQDWSAYSGIRFWLYGNNTGATIQMD